MKKLTTALLIAAFGFVAALPMTSAAEAGCSKCAGKKSEKTVAAADDAQTTEGAKKHKKGKHGKRAKQAPAQQAPAQ